MTRETTLRNALWATAYVVVGGATLLLLYKFLLLHLGVAQLGVWALVLAATSVTRMSELGLGTSVVKFVASHRAHGRIDEVVSTVETAFVAVTAAIGIALLVAYPLLVWALPRFVPVAEIALATRLIPYSLLSLWMMSAAGVLQSALDGAQRADLRNMVMIGTSLLFLGVAVLLVPTFGLVGLACAQVLQSALVLITTWLLVRRVVAGCPLVPYRFNLSVLRDMLNYGVNSQVVSVASMLFDPTTKAMLSILGGLSMVGYFEMASRVVMQCRSLLVAALQVLVPVFAELHERTPEQVVQVYLKAYRILFSLVVVLGCALIAAFPLISVLWIGRIQVEFVCIGLILTAAWAVNTLNAPAYFVNLGTGRLRWNTASHVLIGGMNAMLGWGLGVLWGGYGVVIGWACALAAGSMLIPIMFIRDRQLSWGTIVPNEGRAIAVAALGAAVAAVAADFGLASSVSPVAAGVIALFAFGAIVTVPIWRHPLRLQLLATCATGISRSMRGDTHA